MNEIALALARIGCGVAIQEAFTAIERAKQRRSGPALKQLRAVLAERQATAELIYRRLYGYCEKHELYRGDDGRCHDCDWAERREKRR